MSASASPTIAPVVNISVYRFVRLDRLDERRDALRDLAERLELKGTILLSPEGINIFVSGSRSSIDAFVDALHQDDQFSDLAPKESFSDYQPFNRMLVKIKSEIIAFGVDGVDPVRRTSSKLSARELKRWLDDGRRVHLLDVRNDYEVEVGTFRNAISAHIDNFRDFPQAVAQLPDSLRDEPVVMFCTGGIRCEKAGPFMEQAGFRNIFQLDGGILKYFEECGGDHWDGACFVFDQRVAVDTQLRETSYAQCFVCQAVVSPEDQQQESYVPGQSCPACWLSPSQHRTLRLADLQAKLSKMTTPLPGSVPYVNRRPLNIPERFGGMTLIDCLSSWHPQVPRADWLQKIAASQIVPSPRYGRRRRRMPSPEETTPLSPDRIVRAGERLEHLLPGSVEPAVNADIDILFEDDDFVVVNKPAPLPLHPSGRFNRNTLQYFLDQLYAPRRPLPVHRLDANTTGVLVLCRRRSVARIVQPQFARREVRKRYVARIHGRPSAESFSCSAAISEEPGTHGLREIAASGGLDAHTEFQVLRRFDDGTCVVEAIPHTGRTNQIRLHLWHLGWPIVGDPAWPPTGGLGESRTLGVEEAVMCLHAWSISLTDLQGERRHFAAPLPDWAER